jgi:hypothetical protein
MHKGNMNDSSENIGAEKSQSKLNFDCTIPVKA